MSSTTSEKIPQNNPVVLKDQCAPPAPPVFQLPPTSKLALLKERARVESEKKEKKLEESKKQIELFYASNKATPNKVFTLKDFLDSNGNPIALNIALRDEVTSIPMVYVVPNILNEKECSDLVGIGEEHGLETPSKYTLRTSKRTKYYMDEPLSKKVLERLPQSLIDRLESDTPHNGNYQLHGIHKNWRIIRYDEGDEFPAHCDQSDSIQVLRESGEKDLVVSSHTVIVSLSDTHKGGATRFYPRNNYEYLVDVHIPKGWALLFQQNGTLHSGTPVVDGKKYIAQAGLLRVLSNGEAFKPNVFRFGPGLNAKFLGDLQ